MSVRENKQTRGEISKETISGGNRSQTELKDCDTEKLVGWLKMTVNEYQCEEASKQERYVTKQYRWKQTTERAKRLQQGYVIIVYGSSS